MSKLFSESLGWIRRSLSEHESVHETKSAPPPDTNNPRVATAAVKQLSVGSEGSSTAGGADPPPPLIDAGNGDDDDFDDELEMVGDSVVLTRDDCLALNLRLPPRLVGSPWRLVFSTDRDGFSLKSVYRKMEQMEKDAPALIAIRDTDDCCFGALVSHNLRVTEKFYGTGESFLFRIRPEFKVYPWASTNQYFISCTNDTVNIGAGDGHFGLSLDGDLNRGRTMRCETFDNDPLVAHDGDFQVRTVEFWSFQ